MDDEVEADKVAAAGRRGGTAVADDVETGAEALETDEPSASTLRYLRVVGDIGAVKLASSS